MTFKKYSAFLSRSDRATETHSDIGLVCQVRSRIESKSFNEKSVPPGNRRETLF
jgi:hypothetical protein